MPRIYASNNDPLDFCRAHFPNEITAMARYYKLGDGPDGRGNCFEYEAEHPDYAEDSYACETCGLSLGRRDN